MSLLWRVTCTQYLIYMLVSDDNQIFTIESADFVLASVLIQLNALAHCYEIRERTALRKTEKINTIF